jgi:hypothetical protein
MRAKAVPVHSGNLPNERGAQTASVFTPLVKYLFLSNIGHARHVVTKLPLAGQLPYDSQRLVCHFVSFMSADGRPRSRRC